MTVLSIIFFLVLFPALLGYWLYSPSLSGSAGVAFLDFLDHKIHTLAPQDLTPGDHLVYSKQKVSPRPGPRARNIQPSANGDDYSYDVDKFWTVAEVLPHDQFVAVTRTGKRIVLRCPDPRLRKAGWRDRRRNLGRFPGLAA